MSQKHKEFLEKFRNECSVLSIQLENVVGGARGFEMQISDGGICGGGKYRDDGCMSAPGGPSC